jgi:peptidyl-dipeptidase Dcp
MDKSNPLINSPKLKYKAVPFELILPEHFIPAFEYAIDKAKDELTLIEENPADPTFENTIVALECRSPLFDRINKIFRFLISHESTHELKNLANQINPQLAEFRHSILVNKNIFKKAKVVYDSRKSLKLNDEQIRLVEDRYDWYIKNGANLSDDKQEELKSIKMELSQLGDLFSKNLLDSTNAFELHITDESELGGIPETSKDLMAKTAIDKGKSSGWLILLQQPYTVPILTYSTNRKLREIVFQKIISQAYKDEFDNQEIILRKAKLSHRMANLLGHKTYADFKLQDRMAENLDNVKSFLDKFYKISKPKADIEMV